MLSQIFTLLSLATLILADVAFSSPKSGDSYAASGGNVEFTVKWTDTSSSSDDTLSLDNVKSYTLSLCTGANTDIQCLNDAIFSDKTFTDYTYDATLAATLVPSGYWYLQMYTTFDDGSTTISYSGRFELTGMTGPTATYVVTATGNAPDGQTSTTGAAGSTSVDSRSFTVPYTEQTGIYRYAPMQTQPGSTVTAKTWTTRYPTSAYTVFTSAASPADIVTTITPGWDYTPESAANWASVAPFPTVYYPASDRVTAASLTSQNKKRWI